MWHCIGIAVYDKFMYSAYILKYFFNCRRENKPGMFINVIY